MKITYFFAAVTNVIVLQALTVTFSYCNNRFLKTVTNIFLPSIEDFTPSNPRGLFTGAVKKDFT